MTETTQFTSTNGMNVTIRWLMDRRDEDGTAGVREPRQPDPLPVFAAAQPLPKD